VVEENIGKSHKDFGKEVEGGTRSGTRVGLWKVLWEICVLGRRAAMGSRGVGQLNSRIDGERRGGCELVYNRNT